MDTDRSNKIDSEKLSFEAALNKAGVGLYSYWMTFVTGFNIIAFGCVAYGSTFIVPTSACELSTNVTQQGLLAAGPVIGLIFGAIVWGYLADTRGRRKMLLVALPGAALFNAISTISVNWLMMLVFQFVAALFASAVFSLSMALLSESVPMASRNVLILLVSSIFILTQGIMALIAMPIIRLNFSYYMSALDIYWNPWRTLMLVFSVPSVIATIFVYILNESPKFVFVKGDEAGALKILRSIHRVNHLSSKEELEVAGLQKEEASERATTASVKDQILPLFKAPLLKYTIIMIILYVAQQVGAFMIWLPTISNQFVRVLQTGEGFNLTMCGIIDMDPVPADPDATPCGLDDTSLFILLGVGVIQSVVNLFASLSINFVGRRNLVLITTTLFGVCGLLVNVVPNIIGSAVLFVIFLQGIIVMGLYMAIAVTLFPTNLRAIAIALLLTGGRLGTFASLQILNLLLATNCQAGFYIFISIFTSSAVAASFLPDDRRLAASKPSAVKEEAKDTNKDTHL